MIIQGMVIELRAALAENLQIGKHFDPAGGILPVYQYNSAGRVRVS